MSSTFARVTRSLPYQTIFFIFLTALARLLPYFGTSGYHSGIAYTSWPGIWLYVSTFGSLGWRYTLERFPLSMSRFSSRHKTRLSHQLDVHEPIAHLNAPVCSHSAFAPWDWLAPAIFASACNFVWVSASSTRPTSKSRFNIFFFNRSLKVLFATACDFTTSHLLHHYSDCGPHKHIFRVGDFWNCDSIVHTPADKWVNGIWFLVLGFVAKTDDCHVSCLLIFFL